MTFTTAIAAAAHYAQVALSVDEEATNDLLSPAFAGSFFVVAALSIAVFFLGLDLVRRLRRAKYRVEIQQDLEAELAERDASGGRASQAQPSAEGQDDPRPTEEHDNKQ